MLDALGLVLAGLLCLAVPAALIVLIVVLTKHANKRRRERMAGIGGWAHHRDWDYRPVDPALVDRFHEAPFQRGRHRQATNVVSGRLDGRAFVAFDYSYVTGSGDDSSTHRLSALAMQLPQRGAPVLSVSPTTGWGSLVNAITGRDVLVGEPRFDECFTVTCPAPAFARDVLSPEVQQVMWHHPTLAWQLQGDSMLVLRAGEHSPAEVEAKLVFMDAILDRVPRLVWDRLAGEPPR